MKVLLDTSVLIAAVIAKHDSHAKAFLILERVQNRKDEGFVAAHSLAEMYAILTKLPPPFRHSPEQALLSIEENVLSRVGSKGTTPGRNGSLLVIQNPPPGVSVYCSDVIVPDNNQTLC